MPLLIQESDKAYQKARASFSKRAELFNTFRDTFSMVEFDDCSFGESYWQASEKI